MYSFGLILVLDIMYATWHFICSFCCI